MDKNGNESPLPTWAVVGTKLFPMLPNSRALFKKYEPYDLFVDFIDKKKIVIIVYRKGTKKSLGTERLLLKDFSVPGGWTANDYYAV